MMAKIGYARVSTRTQKDDSQVDDLTAYGCGKIFTDAASGKNAARPELDKALAYLREGDVFVITRLSRAMRSLKHLLALADQLRERGVGLVVLKQQIDTTTPAGRLVFHIFGATPLPPATAVLTRHQRRDDREPVIGQQGVELDQLLLLGGPARGAR
jgi:DNA invertase Pin-like site-specific DNA recombinase